MVDHAELLERLGQTPGVARAAAAASPAGGQVRADGAGWPPVVVLGHLAYVDEHVWLPRLHQMAVEDVPVWQWWEPDGVDWVGLYGSRSPDEVADEFEMARNATIAHLQALPDEGWARRARHAVFGELAVAGLCEEVLAHDHDHLGQLREG